MSSLIKIADEEDKRILVDQYKILTDSINKLNDIRESANNFWTGLNGTLIAAIAYVKDMQSIGESPKFLFLVTILFLGMILSLSWLVFLLNIKKNIDTLNDMLIEIEGYLPAKIFTFAICVLGRKSGRGSLSLKEMVVPILFILGYIFFAGMLYFYPKVLF